MKKIILLAVFCAFLMSCENEVTTRTTTEKELVKSPEIEKITYEEGANVYLKGVYATSTKSPEIVNQINHIFDENGSKYWSTMPGLAPDEGFMLYFDNETYVGQILLENSKGSRFADLMEVTLYGNGRNLGAYNATESIQVDTLLNTLYVRFSKVGTKKGKEIVPFKQGRFDENYALGIRHIKLLDKEGKLYNLIPPKSINGVVQASSTLSPANAYHVGKLFDSRKELVWVEGNKGSGVGESLSFILKENVTMSAIEIQNGYQRSEAHYKANARIKTLEFTDGKEQNHTFQLKDSPETQRLELPSIFSGNIFFLKIIDVYKGTKYQDLAVSELRLFYEEQAYIIAVNDGEQYKKALLKEINATILAGVVDRTIKNVNESTDIKTNNSIVFRSNGTFVMYEHESDKTAVAKEIIADGNWEILESNTETAKVKVFGKFFNLKDAADYYRRVKATKTNRIFKDELTISSGQIKGGKFIGTFNF